MGARRSVVLRKGGVAPQHRGRDAGGRAWRHGRRRAYALFCVIAAHLALYGLAVLTPDVFPAPQPVEGLVAVFVRPKVIVHRDAAAEAARPTTVRVPVHAPLVLGAVPEADRPTVVVIGTGRVVPHPEPATVDAVPYARQAGLQPGEGATVVLRVEVQGTGELSRVEIDVSGGTPEIDQAAIAYATAVRWAGGMIDGKPATMWIRWGVRLQA